MNEENPDSDDVEDLDDGSDELVNLRLKFNLKTDCQGTYRRRGRRFERRCYYGQKYVGTDIIKFKEWKCYVRSQIKSLWGKDEKTTRRVEQKETGTARKSRCHKARELILQYLHVT
jgi:hypothetical protein